MNGLLKPIKEKLRQLQTETVPITRCAMRVFAGLVGGVGYGVIIGAVRIMELVPQATSGREAHPRLDEGGWLTAVAILHAAQGLLSTGVALMGLFLVLMAVDARLAPPSVKRRDITILYIASGLLTILFALWIASRGFLSQ